MSHLDNNKRLAKNTLILYARTAIVLVVQLFVTRLILKALGAENYGIYNVVGSIVILISFVNSAMASASQRFITFELAKGDDNSTSKVFSASLLSQILIAVIFFFVIELVGLLLINYNLNIPTEKLWSANVVFQFSVLTFLVQIIKVPFDATVIAHERFNIFAYISIIDVFIKLLIAVALFYSPTERLIAYSFYLFCNSCLILGLYICVCRKKFDTCRFYFIKERDVYFKIISFSGWSLLGSFANILTQQGFIFLLNIFFGVIVNASMGIANQVSGAVSSFMGNFLISYRPQMTKDYAQNDIQHLCKMISVTSKMSFTLMVVPITFLVMNMPMILSLWLGDYPKYTVEFCQIVLFCVLVDSISSPYNTAIMATGYISNYQIFISVSYFLDLVCSYLLIKNGVVPYAVLLSRLITRGVLNLIIGLYFIHKLLNFDTIYYIKRTLLPISCLIVFIIFLSLCQQYINHSYNFSFLFSLLIIIASMCFMFLFVFDKTERKYIYNICVNYLKNSRILR